MKLYKRIITIMFALLISFTIYGSQLAADEPIKLEFFQQKMEEGPQQAYQDLIDKFNKENPGIIIEMNTVPDAGSVLISRLGSDDIPPIFSDYPTQMQFKEKVRNGYILELTGQDFLERVNPAMLEMAKASDGGTYALPYSQNYVAVFYNIDMFEEYDLEIPTTYDELIAICEKLQTEGVQPFILTYRDAGRVGHMFQAMIQAWNPGGVEKIIDVIEGNSKMVGDEGFTTLATKMLDIDNFTNEDAFGISDTAMWEGFANGEAAMCITGSYARGTIYISNPDLNMGAFPLPNDKYDDTYTLSGVDAAISIAANLSSEEEEAALKFLDFLSTVENAQHWSNIDGAPSCIVGTEYLDSGVQPVLDLVGEGRVHDWFAATIEGQIQSDIYNVVQEFLIDQEVGLFLENLDTSIEDNR